MLLVQRLHLARFVLAIAILAAIYIAIPSGKNDLQEIQATGDFSGWAVWTIALVDELKRIEILHLLTHSAVFGGVALLLGDWGIEGGSTELGLRYVLGGTILMELGQTLVGYSDDTLWSWLWGTGLDAVVNLSAALLALGLLKRYQSVK